MPFSLNGVKSGWKPHLFNLAIQDKAKRSVEDIYAAIFLNSCKHKLSEVRVKSERTVVNSVTNA